MQSLYRFFGKMYCWALRLIANACVTCFQPVSDSQVTNHSFLLLDFLYPLFNLLNLAWGSGWLHLTTQPRFFISETIDLGEKITSRLFLHRFIELLTVTRRYFVRLPNGFDTVLQQRVSEEVGVSKKFHFFAFSFEIVLKRGFPLYFHLKRLHPFVA